jgi:hypothetical protein
MLCKLKIQNIPVLIEVLRRNSLILKFYFVDAFVRVFVYCFTLSCILFKNFHQ